MSCNKVNNCKKYKMNIGNPNDWENPCNRCHYNISDYDIGYNKAIDDFIEKVELKYLGVNPDELYEKYYPSEICKQIKKLAKQLKVGDNNGT